MSKSFFLFMLIIGTTTGFVSLVKIVIVQGNVSLAANVNRLVEKMAYDGQYAPQVYEVSRQNDGKDACEQIGNIDRAKSSSDVVVVFRSLRSEMLDCDPEWGRQNFFIVVEDTRNETFDALVKVTSTERQDDQTPINRDSKIGSIDELIALIKKKQYKNPFSRIPKEYPFEKERQRQEERRKFLAVIAILVLFICSLLAMIFIGSLKRYNDRKKTTKDDKHHQKKSNDALLPDAAATAAKKTQPKKKEAAELLSSKEEVSERRELLISKDEVKTMEKGPSLKSELKSEKTKSEKKSEASEKPAAEAPAAGPAGPVAPLIAVPPPPAVPPAAPAAAAVPPPVVVPIDNGPVTGTTTESQKK